MHYISIISSLIWALPLIKGSPFSAESTTTITHVNTSSTVDLAARSVPAWGVYICTDASIDKYMNWNTGMIGAGYPGSCALISPPGTHCDTFPWDKTRGVNYRGSTSYVRPIGADCYFYKDTRCDGQAHPEDSHKSILHVKKGNGQSLAAIPGWDKLAHHYKCKKP